MNIIYCLSMDSTKYLIKNSSNSQLISSIQGLDKTIKLSFSSLDDRFDKLYPKNKYFHYTLVHLLLDQLTQMQAEMNTCIRGCRTQAGVANIYSCYSGCIDETRLKIVDLEYKFSVYIEDNSYHITNNTSENRSRLNDSYELKRRPLSEDIYKKFI